MNESTAMARTHASIALLLLALPLAPIVHLLPPSWVAIMALTLIAMLGIPHGADDLRLLLDSNSGTPRTRLAMAAIYLAVALATIVVWFAAQRSSLLVFLALSIYHFGSGDALPKRGALRFLDASWRGLLILVVPCLLWPAQTMAAFASLCGDPVFAGEIVARLGQPSMLALMGLLAAAELGLSVRKKKHRLCLTSLAEGALLVVWFAVATPLFAFAVYFVGVHAVSHYTAISGKPFDSIGAAWRHGYRHAAAPTLAATAGLGLILWFVFAQQAHGSGALLRTVFVLISALTVPHIWVVQRWRSRSAHA